MFDIFSIIKYIKSKISFRDIFIVGILLIFFLATRLINLEKFPIFTDEGIYIHWAKLAWRDASWRFVSLTDGRQPLQTWATIPLLKIFPNDALLAGRLFAVLTGSAAFFGLFILLFYLFGKQAAYIGLYFYIFTPYFLFYDRLALMDSGINAAFIWILLLSIYLVKSLRLDVALIFGLTAGLSLLAKSSTQLFLGLSVLAPIFYLEKKISAWMKKTINYFLLFSITLVISLAVYNIQRLSPFFHFVAEKNHTFILTLPELLKKPFDSFHFNIYIIPYYILVESGFFLPLLGLIGWGLLLKKNRRLGLYLTAWTLIPYIIISFFARVLFPRYIIFFATLFVIYLTYLIINLQQKNKYFSITILIVFFLFNTYFNFTTLFDYKNVPLPEIDRGQYIEGGSSGYGIKEVVEYARQLSKNKPVRILAEGNFGMSGDVLDVFLQKDDKISIKSYWPLQEKDLIANQIDLLNEHILVLYVYRSDFPPTWPIRLIKRYEKPGGKSAINLFALTE